MADASMSAQVAEEGRRPHRGAFPLPEARGRCPQGAAVLSGPRLSQVPAPLNLLGGSLSAAFALSVSLI